MKKKNTFLFDLDGTLTDPMIGITKSVQYALKNYGIIEEDLWNLTKFIGPPLAQSFQKYYGFSEEESHQAVEYYREYFAPTGKFENVVYDGIPTMLGALKEAGFVLAVATSKPEVFAKDILKHFNLEQYFDFVGGALLHGRTDKAEVIAYVLENLNVEKDKVVMIGDREHDSLGAAKNDLDSIGVLYGYGDRVEHEAAGAGHIVETVEELEKYLLSLI
ncbi:MAG: HAD family hydrolase [Lachnospiraceae bacterium]|nr:HAD family hydrolase [Lachnospiraceae bacterium]